MEKRFVAFIKGHSSRNQHTGRGSPKHLNRVPAGRKYAGVSGACVEPVKPSSCATDAQVMHSDIKSRNVFLTKNKDVAKIGDVGVAQFLSSTVHDDRVSCAPPCLALHWSALTLPMVACC